MPTNLFKFIAIITAILVSTLASSVESCSEEVWAIDVNKMHHIDAIFKDCDSLNSPGAAVGVARFGELIYGRGFGTFNLKDGGPIEPDTLFYIASASKQFTAAGIALLAIQEQIDLDDDVRKWIPELAKATTAITVRHLLHHTSGIPDYGPLMIQEGRTFNDVFDNDDTIATLTRHKRFDFSPGEKFAYCNSNYVLLAVILERASGMSLQEFTEQHIFSPLGMNNTKWGDGRRSLASNQALSYVQLNEVGLKRFDINFNGYGDGNLWTTVEDLALWEKNFYEPKVGGREFLELMLSRGRLNSGKEIDYAFGLSHGHHRGMPIVSHAGSIFGYSADMIRFPERNLSVIVLANLSSIDASELAKQVADIVLK